MPASIAACGFCGGGRTIGGVDDHALGQRRALRIDELQLAGGANGLDRLVRIVDAGQFDDDAFLALKLHNGLGHAQTVDAILDNGLGRVHGAGFDRLAFDQIGFQQYLGAAPEIQPQLHILEITWHAARARKQVLHRAGMIDGQRNKECDADQE